jgi:hypothetical protein
MPTQQLPWWTALLPLLGVVIGFLLGQGALWWAARKRRRNHWAALSAELEYCRRKAEAYTGSNVGAPLYRLPTAAYTRSFAALLSDAAGSESDACAIVEFFSEVETVNRGIDRAAEAHGTARYQAEVERAIMKAKRLALPTPGTSNYYSAAREALNRHYVVRLTT